jgi:hypothetical protein
MEGSVQASDPLAGVLRAERRLLELDLARIEELARPCARPARRRAHAASDRGVELTQLGRPTDDS